MGGEESSVRSDCQVMSYEDTSGGADSGTDAILGSIVPFLGFIGWWLSGSFIAGLIAQGFGTILYFAAMAREMQKGKR